MVTVVIPAFNEEKYLPLCLDSLVRQNTARPFEVIVVDNASTDGTKTVAGGYRDRLNIRILDEPRRGRGRARFAGFAAATGDILLSTDADTILPPTWIDAFVSVLEGGTYAAATGAAIITDLSPLRNRLFNSLLPFFIRLNVLWFGHVGLSGYSFSIRKDIYEAAGGFDPETDAYEDLDLAARVQKLGKIALVLSPRPIFSGRRFHRGFLKGWLEYMRAFFEKFIRRKKRVNLSTVK